VSFCLASRRRLIGPSSISRLRPRGGLIPPAVENPGDQDVPVVSVVDDVILDGE
jgi:hypothetical protein